MATVLILGAASDMAVAIARKFASEGYNLQLAARDAQRLNPLSSDLQIRYNIQSAVFEFDARDFSSHDHFCESLPEFPDITICVFGYLGDNPGAISDWNQSLKIIESNYTGAVSVLNRIASEYRGRKKGIIVGISSVAGDRGRSSNYIYGSAKAGFSAYLSGLRNELFHHNVHVLTVLPGFVYTSMTENLKLPPVLTARPSEVANDIYHGVISKKNIIYTKWFWRWIMLIIKLIPEFIFKKLKL